MVRLSGAQSKGVGEVATTSMRSFGMTADNWSTGVAANLPGRQSVESEATGGCASSFPVRGQGTIQIIAFEKLCQWACALGPWGRGPKEAEERDSRCFRFRPRLHQLVQGPGQEPVAAWGLGRDFSAQGHRDHSRNDGRVEGPDLRCPHLRRLLFIHPKWLAKQVLSRNCHHFSDVPRSASCREATF